MRVPAEGICLPDRETDIANRFTVTIENAPSDLDDFALRNSINAFDGGQVIRLRRRASYWKMGAQNLVRGSVSVGAVVRGDHDRPQSSGVKPEACTIGPQRSKS